MEDNSADIGLVRRALQEHGIEGELLVVGDGERAIEYVKAIDMQSDGLLDLVIVDLNLPKRSGKEVLESLQSTSLRSVPTAVLSSSDALLDHDEVTRLGVRYIRKPIRLNEFLGVGAILKQVLKDAQRNVPHP